jgi:hypothetical protein
MRFVGNIFVRVCIYIYVCIYVCVCVQGREQGGTLWYLCIYFSRLRRFCFKYSTETSEVASLNLSNISSYTISIINQGSLSHQRNFLYQKIMPF